MSRISSKNKRKVSNIQKHIHVENNSTTSEQEEPQLTVKSSNNLSYVWDHFTVLDDKIHAQCQICDRKGKNIKYVFYGTTSNMIYYLENKHGITKNNSTGDKAARKKQPIIEIAMLTWMIDNCQPLYLLRSKSFKSFIEVALPEFKVPSDDKI
ncbi:23369_t:CDS:2 [Gigaspora rosea]|nr:23369_t:CDS:2 [Gigaspora rosea]